MNTYYNTQLITLSTEGWPQRLLKRKYDDGDGSDDKSVTAETEVPPGPVDPDEGVNEEMRLSLMCNYLLMHSCVSL